MNVSRPGFRRLNTRMLFLRYLLQLILAPHTGWSDISSADKPVSFWLTKGFYPLLGAGALSCFASLIYHQESTVGVCLQNAIILFIGYFASYFIAGLIFSTAYPKLVQLPDESELTHNGVICRFNIMTLFSLGLMVLLTLIENLLPFDIAVTRFLFLYVLFIIYRAADFIGVTPVRAGLYTLTSFVAVFIPPFLIIMWLSSLLN